MKNSLQTLLGATGLALLSISPALAVEGLSANAAVTSNYIWRGVSQTIDQAAVQGGVDFALPGTGFAVGAWASSVNFEDGLGTDDDSPVELDLYGSFSGEIAPSFTYKVGVIGYIYPDEANGGDYDFVEFLGGLSYDFGVASLGGTVYYSPDTFASAGRTWYFSGDAKVPFAEHFALIGHLGYYDFDTGTDYTDWGIGLSATLDQFTLTGMYTDTDVDVISAYGHNISDGAFFVSLSFVTP